MLIVIVRHPNIMLKKKIMLNSNEDGQIGFKTHDFLKVSKMDFIYFYESRKDIWNEM